MDRTDSVRVTDVLNGARLLIISGHFGVGKSECAIALAMDIHRERPDGGVTLIDLDVVNPYFRSREARYLLEERGIRVIGNSLGVDSGVDLPAIPGSVAPALSDPTRLVIVDLGGDPVGARSLRQFRPSIPTEDALLLYVFNAYREQNADAGRAEVMLRAIEEMTGLSCGGIINNTHLLSETTCDHLLKGERTVRELSEITGLPVLFHFGRAELLRECSDALSGVPIEITGALRKDWMN
ncbi:MAG: hypothetical protein WCY01_02165 [Alkalispirochaeta sp.]